MNTSNANSLRIAILDLYDGSENEGMRCLLEIVEAFKKTSGADIDLRIFDVRGKSLLPDNGFDIYLSSGGPGSPLESNGKDWDNRFVGWLDNMKAYNRNPEQHVKKHIYLICHSLQVAVRHWSLAQVTKRKRPAYGIFPVHPLPSAHADVLFQGLDNPFYSVDSREYQIVQPNHENLMEMGATLLAIEKERPHVPLERAIMAIRFDEWMVGSQFHAEADVQGMYIFLNREDKKKQVIEIHGMEKWQSMLDSLQDPEKIERTYHTLLPGFLKRAFHTIVKQKLEAGHGQS